MSTTTFIGAARISASDAYDLLSAHDFEQPAGKWRRDALLSVINIYKHHHCNAIGYVSEKMCVSRLLLAYNNGELDNADPETLSSIDMDFMYSAMAYEINPDADMFTLYNCLCAVVRISQRLHPTEEYYTDPGSPLKSFFHVLRANVNNDVIYATAVKFAVFNMVDFGLPSALSVSAMRLLCTEYTDKSPRNVLHAIESGRRDVVEYFARRDFFDDPTVMDKQQYVSEWLGVIVDKSVECKKPEMAVYFLQQFARAASRSRALKWIENNMKMSDRPHVLYDCCPGVFQYFAEMCPKIIRPAVYIKHIAPGTFVFARERVPFKRYTIFLMHNIYTTSPAEYDAIVGRGADEFVRAVHLVPADFYAYARRPTIDPGIKMKIINDVLRFATAAERRQPLKLNLHKIVLEIDDQSFRLELFNVCFTTYRSIFTRELAEATWLMIMTMCKDSLEYWPDIVRFVSSDVIGDKRARDILSSVVDGDEGRYEMSLALPAPVLHAIQEKFTEIDYRDYNIFLPIYQSVKHWSSDATARFVRKLSVPGVVSFMFDWTHSHPDWWYELCVDIKNTWATDRGSSVPPPPDGWCQPRYADRPDAEYTENVDVIGVDDKLVAGLDFMPTMPDCQMHEKILNGVFVNFVHAACRDTDIKWRVIRVILGKYAAVVPDDPADEEARGNCYYFKIFRAMLDSPMDVKKMMNLLRRILPNSDRMMTACQFDITVDRFMFILNNYTAKYDAVLRKTITEIRQRTHGGRVEMLNDLFYTFRLFNNYRRIKDKTLVVVTNTTNINL